MVAGQMNEQAFPIILAWKSGLTDSTMFSHAKSVVHYIVNHGSRYNRLADLRAEQDKLVGLEQRRRMRTVHPLPGMTLLDVCA
jgi:hypothetical protein